MTTSFSTLVQALAGAGAEFILVGGECRCLSLERLIAVNRAAGRPKDLDAVAELEALAEERRR